MNRKIRGSEPVRQPMIYLRSWADDMRDRSDDLGVSLDRARSWVAYHRPSFECIGDRVFDAWVSWAGWPRANRYGFAGGGVVGITASGLLGLVLLAGPKALPSVVAPPSGLLDVGAGPTPSPVVPLATESLPFRSVASAGPPVGDFNRHLTGAPVMGPPSAVPSAGTFGPLPAARTATQSAPLVRPAPPPHAEGRPQPPSQARTPMAPPPNAQGSARPQAPAPPPPPQAPPRPPQAQAPAPSAQRPRPPQAQAPARPPKAQAPRPPRAQAPARPPQAQAPKPRPPQAQAPARPPKAQAPARPPQAQAPKARPPQAQAPARPPEAKAPARPPQVEGPPARPPQAKGPKK